MNPIARRACRTLVVVLAAWLCLATPLRADAPALQKFRSKSYLIYTNLTKDEVRVFGKHMDEVFAQFESRFRDFDPPASKDMPLYLLRTEQQYHALLDQFDIDATNSGGLFFYSPKGEGLATWTQGRSRGQTFQVLQHEGFHQFAFHYIGHSLPYWVSEGLAKYFEDAIIVGNKMTTGLANARRVEQVKRASSDGRLLSLSELVDTTPEDWTSAMQHDPQQSELLYAQSWSIVYYLIHGGDGKYQLSFGRYLRKLSTGIDSRTALIESFEADELESLEADWLKYAARQMPDPLNQAAERMEFLAEALRYMHQNGEASPKNIKQLRRILQARHFVLRRTIHGITIEMDARDPDLYRYARGNGSSALFRLLEPSRNDLPARVTAPGLRPEPTLVWSHDSDGNLVHDIEYR